MDAQFVKIFAGYKLSSDLKGTVRSGQSIDPIPELKIITHAGKEYFGFYLLAPHPSLAEVQSAFDNINTLVANAFPGVRFPAHAFVVFPQLFLA